MLDFPYYNRLLLGALLELEKTSQSTGDPLPGGLALSTRIEAFMGRRGGARGGWGRWPSYFLRQTFRQSTFQ